VLSRSTVVIGADYRGLRVDEATALRRQLREAGIEMHVIKNTLFLRAADILGKPELSELAEGPTALIIGFGDPIAPVKTVVEYQRTARNTFAARKAYLDGQIIAPNQLTQLATLPPKEMMIAEIAGALQSQVVTFVYLLEATLQEFAGLIDARTEQMGGASGATAPASEPEAAAAGEPEAAADREPEASSGEVEASEPEASASADNEETAEAPAASSEETESEEATEESTEE
jgi:large subunit ribosomal protein L10